MSKNDPNSFKLLGNLMKKYNLLLATSIGIGLTFSLSSATIAGPTLVTPLPVAPTPVPPPPPPPPPPLPVGSVQELPIPAAIPPFPAFVAPATLPFTTQWSNTWKSPVVVIFSYNLVEDDPFFDEVFPRIDAPFTIPPGGGLITHRSTPTLTAAQLNLAVDFPEFGFLEFEVRNPRFFSVHLVPTNFLPFPIPIPLGKDGGSGFFETENSQLSFNNVEFTESSLSDGTVFPDDPIVGATINMPTLTLSEEILPGQFLFINENSTQYTVTSPLGTFLTASLNELIYLEDSNTFFSVFSDLRLSGADISSPFFDPTLPDLGSEYISRFESVSNPNSSEFVPDLFPYLVLQPSVDILSTSVGFTENVSFTFNSRKGPAKPVPVPEPVSTLALLTLGTIGIALTLRRKINSSKSINSDRACLTRFFTEFCSRY